MLETILSLATGGGASILSALGGGVLRLVPELIALWNKKVDHAHELAMLEKQHELEMDLDRQKAEGRVREMGLANDSAALLASLEANRAALGDQMKGIGLWWVDAANALVRPLATYYFLGCYGIYKTAMLATALTQTNPWAAIIQCYTADDMNILFGILGFWFVGRKFDKQ
jgi:hypothetical protein